MKDSLLIMWKLCFLLIKMLDRRRIKFSICILVGFMATFAFLCFGYFCPDRICALTVGPPTPPYQTPFDAYIDGGIIRGEFGDEALERDYEFDMEDGQDVIVFLHIQKTGGTTFGRHLVKNIHESPCQCYKGKKKCDCQTPNSHVWLVSRFSTGWKCGLHADWTELKNCVHEMVNAAEGHSHNRRYRYLYITILRDPFYRYLSEYRHVQRGATWLSARLACNGRQASLEEVPFCFQGEDWSGVSLNEFMGCPHNLANNRQTRMLANLSLIGCYDKTVMEEEKRNQIMLQSAKDNLKNMSFFGLTEFQEATQYMFERTFKLKFIEDFEQRNSTHARETDVEEMQKSQILALNRLDVELYQFAKDLFFQRLQKMVETDPNPKNRLVLRRLFPSYVNTSFQNHSPQDNLKKSDEKTHVDSQTTMKNDRQKSNTSPTNHDRNKEEIFEDPEGDDIEDGDIDYEEKEEGRASTNQRKKKRKNRNAKV